MWKKTITVGFSLIFVVGSPKAQSSKTNASSSKQKGRSASTATSKRSSNSSSLKLDASALKSSSSNKAVQSGTKKQIKKPDVGRAESDPKGLLTADSDDILETIRGINLLLQKNPDHVDKIKLLLNRSMATYSLARRRMVEGKSLKLDNTNRKLFSVAAQDAKSVSVMKDVPVSQRSRAFYIYGLSLIYLEKNKAARDVFLQALNLNPNSSDAGWMALYVAEDYFDEGQFHEAIPYYSKFYSVMDKSEVTISKYKLAWCYLNLKNEEKAMLLFEELIRENANEGFGRDSIKDLAYVMTTFATEDAVIQQSERIFQKNQTAFKIDFLSAVLSHYEIQNAVSIHSKVLARLLELDKDPVKKLQYLLVGLRTTRREYASAAYYDSMVKINQFIQENKLNPSAKNMEAAAASLEIEAQNLIKSFVETFSGRVQTPETNLTKERIAGALKNLFGFYEKYFSEAQAYPVMLRLWLDVCLDTSDWGCADSVAEKILHRKELAAIHSRVALDQIGAIENLARDPKNKLEPRLIKKLEDFSNTQKSSDQWLDVSKRLGEIYMRQKLLSKAIPVFEAVFEKSPTPEHLYRIQWARFEAGDFAAVVQDRRVVAKGDPDPRTNDLKRESALKLAQNARKSDKFDEYTLHIRGFLSLNPEEAKALAARKDWFYYMVEKDKIAELSGELIRLSPALRFSKELSDIFEQAWLRSMRNGQFKNAFELVGSNDSNHPLNAVNKMRRVLAQISMGQRASSVDLKSLSEENRQYVFGVLALARPDWAISYLNEYAPLKESLRGIGALAFRMENGEWNVPATAQARRLLGANFSFASSPNMEMTNVEKMIQKIQVPSQPLKSQAAIARWTQDIVYQTRKVRSDINKSLKTFPLPVQIRSLKSARDLEAKTAHFIKSQPLPPGLVGNDVIQYEAGVAEIVKEFEEASAEFEKLEESLRRTQDSQMKETESRYLPMPNLAKWPWPSIYNSSAMSGLKSLRERHNFLGALIVLDLFRPRPLENQTDYFAIRSGLLFSSKNTRALRRYVLEELEQSGQSDLVKVWREMVKGLSSPSSIQGSGDLDNDL